MASKGNRSKRIYPADMLGIRSGSVPDKDARLTNCIIEINGKELEILKRPGYTALTTSAYGPGLGATPIKDSNGNEVILTFSGPSFSTVSGAYGAQWETLERINGDNLLTNLIVYNGILYASIGTALYTSVNGVTWQAAGTTDGNGPLDMICVFNGILYSAQGAGTLGVRTSTDGLTWTTVAQATPAEPGNIEGFVALGGYLYLVIFPVLGPTMTHQECWRSTDGANWTQRTDAAFTRRNGTSVVVLNGALYSMGGRIDYSGAYLNEVWKSTDGGANWSNVGSAGWSARRYAFAAVLNNLVYIGGGSNTSDLSDLWASQGDATWQQITVTPTPALRGNGLITTSSNDGNAMSRLVAFQNGLFRIQALSASATSQYYVLRSRAGQNGTTTNVPLVAIPSTTTAAPSGSSFMSASPLDISQNLAKTVIALKNTSAAWAITVSGMTIAKVTDSDYPATTVRGIVYLNGVFYVMDTNGAIYGSASEDFTTWTALNKINAQVEPDGGVCLTKYGQYVVAFGNFTTEYFFDAGNATGSPLSPVQNSQLLVGCANGDTVAQNEHSVFFISQSKIQNQTQGKGFSVSRLKGMSYEAISTPDVDRILNADGLEGAWGMTFSILGHDCYVLNLPTSQISLAFDIVSSMWLFLTVQTAQTALTIGTGNMTCAAAYAGSTDSLVTVTYTEHGYGDGDVITVEGTDQGDYDGEYNINVTDANTFTYTITGTPVSPATGTITTTGYTSSYFPMMMAFEYAGVQVFQDRVDGKLYQFDDTIYTDNECYVDAHIRTARLSDGISGNKTNLPKFLAWMDLITDRQLGSIMVRYTDDDYQTYANYKKVSTITARSRVNRLGNFYRRAFEVRHTDIISMRLQALDLGLEDGSE